MGMGETETETKTFIILDGALIDVPRLAYQHDDRPWVDQLYRGTRHEGVVDVSPCLVLPSERSRLWAHQHEWGSFGVGLQTKASPEELANHLRSLLSVRLPNGQLGYCRFYSHTYLPALMDAFSAQEARSFCGPIARWFSVHPFLSFEDVHLAGDGACRSANSEGWFQLSEGHLKALERVRRLEFSAKLCRHLDLEASEEVLTLLQHWQKRAESHGFISEQEIGTFVELALGNQAQMDSAACQNILVNRQLTAHQKLMMIDQYFAYGDA